MRVSRGDVVLVHFPFASTTGTKLRPAVVVQNDRYNRRLNTTVIAAVTSNVRHQSDPCQVAVDPATADGAATGLLKDSAIKCENLATVETDLIRRKIGTLPPALLSALGDAIKDSLGL